MRAHLEELTERYFPGMGFRPLYMSAAASWLLMLYQYHGGQPHMPEWFHEASSAVFGFELVAFHQHMWSHLSCVVLLMLAPLLMCWVMEGWTPRDLGFRVKGAGLETLVVVGMWAFMVPLVYWVHDMPSFASTYPRLPAVSTDARMYLLFEGMYLVKWVAWEFFFRGFMLFGFGKDFLRKAILVSTIPFVLMHYGKPELEMAASMLAGVILCFISLRSRSIWPGVLLHWLVASTMDFMASSFWR